MEYILLNGIEDSTSRKVDLNLGDIKILYNACVDILNEHPEMIGYRTVAEKLKKVLAGN